MGKNKSSSPSVQIFTQTSKHHTKLATIIWTITSVTQTKFGYTEVERNLDRFPYWSTIISTNQCRPLSKSCTLLSSKSCSFALHQGPDCEVRICTVSPARFFTVPDLLCRGRCPLVIFAYDGRFIDRKETRQRFLGMTSVFPIQRERWRIENGRNTFRQFHTDPDDYRLPNFENPRTRPIFQRWSLFLPFFLFFFSLSSPAHCGWPKGRPPPSLQRRINRVAFSPWRFSTDRAKRGPASGQFYLWTGISSGEWAGSRLRYFLDELLYRGGGWIVGFEIREGICMVVPF